MKVKEFIEQLQKLDQEKGIWIIYDCYLPVIPKVDEELLSEEDAEYYRSQDKDCDPQAGDYTITC